MHDNKQTTKRYDVNQRNNKFMQLLSRQIMKKKQKQSQSSRHRYSRILSNNAKVIQQPYQEMYSQGQLSRQRRGASVLRNNSKTNNKSSVAQMRKEFLRDSSLNFYGGIGTKNAFQSKQTETNSLTAINIHLEEDMQIQQIHFQMVKLMQNAKQLQKQI